MGKKPESTKEKKNYIKKKKRKISPTIELTSASDVTEAQSSPKTNTQEVTTAESQSVFTVNAS